MKHIIRTALALTLLAVGGAALAQSGGGYDLSLNTVDGGGTTSAGGVYTLTGTAGQHDAGVLTGGEYTLVGGFWGALPEGEVELQTLIPMVLSN